MQSPVSPPLFLWIPDDLCSHAHFWFLLLFNSCALPPLVQTQPLFLCSPKPFNYPINRYCYRCCLLWLRRRCPLTWSLRSQDIHRCVTYDSSECRVSQLSQGIYAYNLDVYILTYRKIRLKHLSGLIGKKNQDLV